VTNFGPSWSPDGTLIAAPYWSREDGFLQVPVVIDVETGLLRRLTDQRWFQVFRTAWLHDGSGLIFTATAIGETHVQLWHVSYPAGQVRRVTNDLDRYGRTSLGISDDDNVVATGQFKDDGDVWIMDAAGGNGTRLTSGSGSDVVLGWTGNQGLIYYSNLPARSLWMVAADGGAPRRVATDLMFVGPGVSVSPRQDWIAYVAPSEDGVNLWRANLDGSDRVQLTHGGAGHLPVITPDGESVLYIRYEHGRPSVWKVPAGGGEPVQVIGNDAVVLVGAAAQLSPDGQRILTFVRDEQANRRRMAIFSASDVSLEQMLADEPLDAPAQLPRWSPDSRSVVFVRTQGRVSNLWTQSLDGSAPRQITQFETDIIFGFAYSPDGRQLALSRGPVTGEVVLIRNFR
jgi:Tol biopolymer transport system component